MKNVIFAIAALALLAGCDANQEAVEVRTVAAERCKPESNTPCVGIDYEQLREAEKGEIKVQAVEGTQSDHQLVESAKARILALAKPIGDGLFLTDSKGCVWWVGEVDGAVGVTRPLNSDDTPVCAGTAQAN